MSQSIDERIVSMEFDNERFEKNIDQTMKSLDSLDRQIEESAGGIGNSFGNISDGLDRLDLIFSGFYLKIGGYFADLTTKAANFANKLTFGQISKGFEKYTAETKAVQTIISNTDETLDHTYEVLDGILKYTDETSYHYDKLVDTMSSFANTGIDLEKSATAVKGIANWAALSGAGIDNADYAMNALVKSISSGKMQLQEWNTISKVAHMGNKQFVDTLIQTGEQMGVLKKGALTFENFREKAFGQKGLVTAELLLATLEQYGSEETELGQRAKRAASEAKTFEEAVGAVADAVSTGWLKTFDYIFGNYEEAKRVWTGLQDAMLEVFTIGMDFRNEVLKSWHKAEIGGYKDLIDGVSELWSAVKHFAKPIGDAFHTMFGLDDVDKATSKLTNFTKKFKDFATSINAFIRAPEDYEQIFNAIVGGTTDDLDSEFIEKYIDLLSKLDGVTDQGTLMNVLDDHFNQKGSLYKADLILLDIKNTFNGLFSIVRAGVDIFKGFINVLGSVLRNISRLARPLLYLTGAIGRYVSEVADTIKESKLLDKAFDSLSDVINSVVTPVIDILIDGIEFLIRTFDNLYEDGILTNISLFEKLGDSIQNVAKWISGKLTDAFEWLINAAKRIFEKLTPIKTVFDDIGEKVKELFKKTSEAQSNSKIITFLDSVADAIGRVAEWLLNNALLPAAEGFADFIKILWEAAQPLGPALTSVAEAIGKIFDALFSKNKDSEATSPVKALFDALSELVTFLLENAVIPLIQGLADVLKDLADNATPLGKIFEDIKNGVSNFFTGLFGGKDTKEMQTNAESVNNISSFLKTAGEVIGKVAGWIGGIIHNIYENISVEIENLKSLELSDVFKIIKEVLNIITSLLAGRLIWNVGSFAGNLAGITEAINNFVHGLNDSKKASSLILDIGKALLMIAASCMLVASLDPDKLQSAADTINGFIASLVESVIAINAVSSYFTGVKVTGVQGTMLFASNITDIGLAILLIAKAIQMLGSADLDEHKVEVALTAVKELIVELAAVEIAIDMATRIGGKKFGSSSKPKGLLTMIIAVWALSKILQSLAKNVEPDRLEAAADAVMKLLGVVGLIAFALSVIQGFMKEFSGGPNLKVAVNMKTTLLQLALVIAALAGLMYVLSVYVVGNDSLITATACLGGIVLALILLTETVKKMNATVGQIVELYALIGALAAMAGILLMLSEIEFGPMLGGLLGMVAGFVMLIALAGVAETLSGSFAEMVPGLIAMYALIAAIALMSVALKSIQEINFGGVVVGLLAFATAFGVMVGLSFLAELFGGQLLLLDGILIGLGLSLTLVGAGLYLVAKSFEIVMDTVVNAVSVLGTNKKQVLDGLTTMLDIALDALLLFLPSMVNFVISAIVALIRQLAEQADDIIDALVDFILNVAKSIDEHSDEIGEAVATLLLAIINAVIAFFRTILNKLGINFDDVGGKLKNFLESIRTKLREWRDAIKQKWSEMWEKIGEKLDAADQWISEKVEGVINAIVGFFVGLWNDITTGWETFKTNTKQSIENAKKWINETVDAIVGGILGFFNTLHEGIQKIWGKITGLFKKENNQQAINDMKETADALSNASTIHQTTVHTEVYETQDPPKPDPKPIEKLGNTIPQGLASGVKGGKVSFLDEVEDMMDEGINVGYKTVDSHSPSKVFYKLGSFIVQGLANGVSDFSSLATNATEEMAKKSISPMQEAIKEIASLDLSDIGEPTITPVLDLSQIQNGMRSIDSMFGGAYGLSAALNGTPALAATGNSIFTANINVYGAEGQSAQEIASEVSRLLNNQFRQRSNVWK